MLVDVLDTPGCSNVRQIFDTVSYHSVTNCYLLRTSGFWRGYDIVIL